MPEHPHGTVSCTSAVGSGATVGLQCIRRAQMSASVALQTACVPVYTKAMVLCLCTMPHTQGMGSVRKCSDSNPNLFVTSHHLLCPHSQAVTKLTTPPTLRSGHDAVRVLSTCIETPPISRVQHNICFASAARFPVPIPLPDKCFPIRHAIN